MQSPKPYLGTRSRVQRFCVAFSCRVTRKLRWLTFRVPHLPYPPGTSKDHNHHHPLMPPPAGVHKSNNLALLPAVRECLAAGRLCIGSEFLCGQRQYCLVQYTVAPRKLEDVIWVSSFPMVACPPCPMTVFQQEEAEFNEHDVWSRPKTLKMTRHSGRRGPAGLNSAASRPQTWQISGATDRQIEVGVVTQLTNAGMRHAAAACVPCAEYPLLPAPQMISDDDEVRGEEAIHGPFRCGRQHNPLRINGPTSPLVLSVCRSSELNSQMEEVLPQILPNLPLVC